MATLLDLSDVERDSTLNPADFTEPRLTEVQNAVNLRSKIRAALWKRAMGIIDGTLLTTLGPNDQARTAARGWAQRVIQSDGAVATSAMRLLLAKNAGVTKVQILAVTDAALETAIDKDLVLALAEGSMPGH